MLNALSSPENKAAWDDFVDRYRPILIGFARSLGLQETDAEDVAQQTLAAFSVDLKAGKYVRGRGRLRAWMLGIARHRVIDAQRAQMRRKQWRGDSMLVEAADEQQITGVWEDAQRAVIAERAIELLRTRTRLSPSTLMVFELAILRNVPTAEVARQCNMSESEVYVAKSRAAAKLRELVDELREAFDRED